MPSDGFFRTETPWPRVRIADVAEVFDGPHATPTKTSDGPVFLGISSLCRGRLDLSNTEHLSEEEFVKWTKRVTPKAGDVVFSYETRLGEAAIIPEGLRCCLGRRMGLVRTKPTALDPHFFLYQYLSPKFQDFLMSRTIHGSTVDRIALKEFPDFKIDLPPLPVQRVVAKVMLEIDAKIDLNRRINQTLEAMAQAIFKSWFVDFDPVKAKIAAIQEGRDPLRAAMSAISGKPEAQLDALPPEQYEQLAATAALFPDEMEESELGEIPRGWALAALSTVCDLNAHNWSAKTLPESVKYVDLANTKNGEVIEIQTMEGSNIPSRARRILEAGDTIVGTVRPGNRSFALVGEAGLTGSTGFAVLSPKKSYLREYVYLAATADANIERLAHLADGGAYPAVRPELVVSEALPIPREDLLREFHRISAPMFDQVLEMRRANRDLADLRDTLLPKLLSGELSVAEAMAESEA